MEVAGGQVEPGERRDEEQGEGGSEELPAPSTHSQHPLRCGRRSPGAAQALCGQQLVAGATHGTVWGGRWVINNTAIHSIHTLPKNTLNVPVQVQSTQLPGLTSQSISMTD